MKPFSTILSLAFAGAALSLLHPAVQDYLKLSSLIGQTETAAAAPAAPPAMPVPTAHASRKTLPVYLDYPARTEAVRSVSLQAKVSGYLKTRHLDDGADVQAGDLLYSIDDRDYQAALEQAKAQLARDMASVDYLKGNLDRGEELSQKGFLARDSYDQRASTLRQAEAAVAISRAAVRAAELDLERTRIIAPFAGRLGRSAASEGALVSAGSTTLNSLVQLDPIYVTFNPSDSELAAIKGALDKGDVSAEIEIPGSDRRYDGKLTFIDNRVDQSTGTISARATIANAAFDLLPGQYVHLRLSVGEQPDVLMAPQVALGSSQLGKYVYVVGKGGTVEQRMVTVGRTEGDEVAVLSGLGEDDVIISGNLQKIWPGVPVAPLPVKVASN